MFFSIYYLILIIYLHNSSHYCLGTHNYYEYNNIYMTLIYVYYSFHNMNIILYSLLVITIYLCITYSIIKY